MWREKFIPKIPNIYSSIDNGLLYAAVASAENTLMDCKINGLYVSLADNMLKYNTFSVLTYCTFLPFFKKKNQTNKIQ